jgi:hypothetical protein
MHAALTLVLGLWLAPLAWAPPTAPPPHAPADPPPASEAAAPDEAGVTPTPPETEEAAPPTEPAASEPAPDDAPLVDAAEVARLQEEARRIRDELFKARARVSSVTAKLFRSKIVVELRSNVERFYDVEQFTITIDGAPVYFKESGLAPVRGSIVEMFAAPGAHDLGIAVQLTAKRQRLYQLRVDQTFTIVVPEDSRLLTKVVLLEVGNMFTRFDKRKRGAYRVHVELQARAKANSKSRRKTAVTATGKGTIGK